MKTINKINKLVLMVSLTLLLDACGGNNSNIGTVQPAATLVQIAAQNANSESDALDDIPALGTDITAIFGATNGTPTEVETGDRVGDIIVRSWRLKV